MSTSVTRSLDCYSVLGVRPSATIDEIESAYRRALEASPRRGFGCWFAAFWFNRTPRTIVDAYRTLADPVAREDFDAQRRESSLHFAPPY